MVKRNVPRRLAYLLMRSDIEPLRFFVAVSSLLWGILLLMPGETFDRQTYALMSQMGPELLWAAAHITHGVASVYSLLTGAKGRVIFTLDPLLGAFLWTTSGAAMMLAVYPVPAAIAPHLVGAVAAWWLLVRYKDGDDA